MVAVVVGEPALVVGFEEDLAPLGEALAEESAEIAGSDLILLGRVLDASQSARARIGAEAERYRALEAEFGRLPDLSELARELVSSAQSLAIVAAALLALDGQARLADG